MEVQVLFQLPLRVWTGKASSSEIILELSKEGSRSGKLNKSSMETQIEKVWLNRVLLSELSWDTVSMLRMLISNMRSMQI